VSEGQPDGSRVNGARAETLALAHASGSPPSSRPLPNFSTCAASQGISLKEIPISSEEIGISLCNLCISFKELGIFPGKICKWKREIDISSEEISKRKRGCGLFAGVVCLIGRGRQTRFFLCHSGSDDLFQLLSQEEQHPTKDYDRKRKFRARTRETGRSFRAPS